ncbi:DUF1501 domain-containing protein [Rubellicoccus peritrichatus]|uniref:DUF1501 domain-containing protein n=1 Tax=Rubellicoccus peritrichatus TaxID=3080537 RepID=A0AAQ3QVR5_9BACT|nr:DUF1501 domain-containing protein [Puniceicoccus sp. CR14]WOO41117.1 DUF1501 domain-containing protein [Puniceicoccus sp. CR14]
MKEADKLRMSRRRFMGQASCAAVGSTALFSTLFNLRMASAAVSNIPIIDNGEDYKALVCLFLAGGNDSFNMLVPRSVSDYNEYQGIRTDLALKRDSLLPINIVNSDGREFGVHPAMPELQQLFNNGHASMVANVGTLVEPTTLNGVLSGSNRLPLGLYSHSDQIMHWQSSIPDRRSTTGWAGGMADMLQAANQDQRVSMNISVSGNNVFQTGNQTFNYVTSPGQVVGENAEDGDGGLMDQLRQSSIQSMMDQEYRNLFEKNYASLSKGSIEANELFRTALQSAPTIQTAFSANEVSQSFRAIAKTIASRKALGQRRQTFFILFGGWDHHDEVINAQNQMLSVVSKGLSEFHVATQELGVADKVTTFTASDFGRTLTSNGRGSDHAWGGNHIVMGGSVNGGCLFGQYPSLYAGNPLDTGRGRLIPTLSVDEYFAEMAMWMGVDASSLPNIFPNIGRFYGINSGEKPIGFMA